MLEADRPWVVEHREQLLMGISGAALVLGLVADLLIHAQVAAEVLYVVAALAGVVFVAPMAIASLRRRSADMNVLMSIAVLGGLIMGLLGDHEVFRDAAIVIFLDQVGEWLEGWSMRKTSSSIQALAKLAPDTAHLVHGEHTHDVSVSTVEEGQRIRILPGERVPLDGIIVEGSTALNTIALTGESMPRDVGEGDEVISGCVNISGAVKVRTTKNFGESTVSKIIHLVENANESKSHSETFITRFARIYTPIVVFAAIILAVVPTLLGGDFATWLYRALMFLVVSCPCALVISVPLTFFGGIGGASRHGILIKGANYIDVLNKVGTVVFDKTGTLTHGQFAVTAVHPDACDEHQLLHLAAHVEHFSTHPIGAALRDAFPDEATDGCQVSDVTEIAGQGIRAQVGDKQVWVGNTKLMDAIGAHWHDCTHVGTIIHVAIDKQYAGHIVINDRIKSDSTEAIASLKKLGVERTVMLTGDRKEVATSVARQLDIDEYHAELLPADKVAKVEQLLTDLHAATDNRKHLAFVGDGINDAPVLARADVGIAMGGLGSDAAIEAADVVLMDDKPSKIALAMRIARRTLTIARQNVWLAIGIKVAVLVLATFGLATMWMAVFADVGVTVLAVLNAMRTMRP
jgi:Cd2+/Zn2+-exporting ATPase